VDHSVNIDILEVAGVFANESAELARVRDEVVALKSQLDQETARADAADKELRRLRRQGQGEGR
jgi:hypothetical protein